MFRSWMATTSLCASTTLTRTAVLRCVVLTLARSAPRNSKDHSTRPGSLWGARVPALQTSRRTQTTPQIVAMESTAPPQPVRPPAFNIIISSNQIARMHTRMLLMSRAAMHFSRAPPDRIILSPSAPKKFKAEKQIPVDGVGGDAPNWRERNGAFCKSSEA